MDIEKIKKLEHAIDICFEKWLATTGTPQQNAHNQRGELEFLLAKVLLQEMYEEMPIEIQKQILHAVNIACGACKGGADLYHQRIKEV